MLRGRRELDTMSLGKWLKDLEMFRLEKRLSEDWTHSTMIQKAELWLKEKIQLNIEQSILTMEQFTNELGCFVW